MKGKAKSSKLLSILLSLVMVLTCAFAMLPVYAEGGVHTIVWDLTNVTSDKGSESEIADGESFTAELTANEGFTLDESTVVITMGEEDITETVYSGGTIQIDAVTGDLSITAKAMKNEPVKHTITWKLSNVTSSNTPSQVEKGNSFSAKLTVSKQGYYINATKVKITMGGSDITSQVYSGGNINISSVTGDLVISATADVAAPPTAPKVTGLKATAGYERVALSWNAVANKTQNGVTFTTRYKVYRNNGSTTKQVYDGLARTYTDKVSPKVSGTYTYTVKAYYVNTGANKNGALSAASASVSKQPVRPMFITAKTKRKTPLYKYRTINKVQKYLPKNYKITAYGGSHWKLEKRSYVLTYKGKEYFARIKDFKNIKIHYTSKDIYTKEEKENYVNQRNIKSNTNYLVWVSTYTQRVNIFKWDSKQKKWKVLKNGWKCNTGNASTPTIYGTHKVTAKYKIDYDIKGKEDAGGHTWWTCFANIALHTKLRPALGKPVSGGCVRLTSTNAKWCYSNIPKGTTVVVY